MSDLSFWLAVVVLTIFCAGEPDLLDAVIKRVGQYETTRPGVDSK